MKTNDFSYIKDDKRSRKIQIQIKKEFQHGGSISLLPSLLSIFCQSEEHSQEMVAP